MSLSRREFLSLMGGASAALAFPSVLLQGCKKALEEAKKRTPVIWLQAQSCSGCSVSLLNTMKPDITTIITEEISLNYHQTIMGGTGHTAVQVLEEAVKKNRKDFVLVVEGSIPTKDDLYCTIGEVDKKHVSAREWVEELGSRAVAIVAVGTCATGGGIPGARLRSDGSNPTGASALSEILKGKTVVNIPGCPPHPDWMVGSLIYLLTKGGPPPLDEYNRPLLFYGKTVHEQCERLQYYKRGQFARYWGDKGCLYELGCLGMDSCCDIPKRKWLGGINSCTGSGAGCIGCTEKAFPDFGKRGIFQHNVADRGNIIESEKLTARAALKQGGVING